MAHPYECCESEPGFPVAGRQLNADVRSRVEYQSDRRGGRYRGGSPMRWIGNRARNNRWKTESTSWATVVFTTSGPRATAWSNVQ